MEMQNFVVLHHMGKDFGLVSEYDVMRLKLQAENFVTENMAIACCFDKMELKKGRWTLEEDLILINHVQRHGHTNWRVVPQQAGLLRCGKSCRLRWVNYLRPDIKRGNFTREEEETIIKLHEMWGNRWSAIAAKLPGRTDNEIKNVWHAYLKKRLPQHTQPKQSQNREQNADQSMESQKFDNQEPTQKEQQQPVMNFNFSTHHDHVIKVAGRDEMSLPLSLPTSSKQDSSRDMSIFTISDSNNEQNNNLIVANYNNVNKDHDMLMNNSVEPQGDEFWSEFLSGDESNSDIGVADLNFKSPFSPISSFHNMDFWQMFK